MTPYKYTPASLLYKGINNNTPKDEYVELFQETLDDGFYNATNWWTIREEYPFGSKEYRDIDVRISYVINAETGLKQGDSWKSLFFKDNLDTIHPGVLYFFDDNFWLTVNTETFKNLTASATVRRCNNTLRWSDEASGAYYEEPCAIEYLVKEPRDYATQGSPFILPGGFSQMYAQLNDRTRKIRQNQRFLFGNINHWVGWKVIGTGVNDYRNMETYDNDSGKVIILDLIANFVNYDLDDVENGIAHVNNSIYELTLNRDMAQGSVGDTLQLSADITYNEKTVTREVEWSTSGSSIATVDDGLVSFISTGSCIITANIKDNPASDSCLINVTAIPDTNYDIVITPTINYVLEESTISYSVYLYENNVQQADVFIVEYDANGIPETSFTLTQTTGNNFTITNHAKNLSSELLVTCTSGIHSTTFGVRLSGAW